MGAIHAHHGLIMAAGASLPTVTWNPSDKASEITLSAGNLTATYGTVTGAYRSVRATHGKSSGKHYFEIRFDQITNGAAYSLFGVCTSAHSMSSGHIADNANGWAYYQETGAKVTNAVQTAYGATYTAADVIGVAVDMDAGKIWFAKNNTWQASGNPAAGTSEAFSGLSGTLFPAVSLYRNSVDPIVTGRFKSSDFSYSPPAGFSPWES